MQGYLAHSLHSNYNFKVLGIEGQERIYKKAREIQKTRHESSQGYVKYSHHFITENSSSFIEKSIKEQFPEYSIEKVSIVGLHACADLSVTILNILLEMRNATNLVIMPCCYHKMNLKVTDAFEREYFENFPVSDSFKKMMVKYDGFSFLKRFFLRNACQKTNSSWKVMTGDEHKLHAVNFMFRAVLQLVIEEGEEKKLLI